MIDEHLSPCYVNAVSDELVRRFDEAKRSIDTWTWMELKMREYDTVSMAQCSERMRGDSRVVLLRQSLEQQLPWEPGLIRITAELPPPAKTEAELELLRAVSNGLLSQEAADLVRGLIISRENACTVNDRLGPDKSDIRIKFWSSPSHVMPNDHILDQDLAHFMMSLGAEYRLIDFEFCEGHNCYLAPWPKLFGCADNVVPHTRAIFAVVSMPATFSGKLTMSVIKRGTSQDTTWCDRFKRAQVSYKDRT